MNIKEERNFYVLVYNEELEEWQLAEYHQPLYFHEANNLKEKYEKQMILAKVLSTELLEDFLYYANRQHTNKED